MAETGVVAEFFNSNWGASLSTAGLMLGVGYFCRDWLKERLAQSIKHEYDERLINLENKLAMESNELEALRSGALQNSAYKQRILFEKRLDAIEKLWGAIGQLSEMKGLCQLISQFNFEQMSEAAAKDEKVREALSVFDTFDEKN